jgi:broad specificity phosphatase PhoE
LLSRGTGGFSLSIPITGKVLGKMQVSRRVILVRHGSIDAGQGGRFVGSTDAPLSVDGQAEAFRLAAPVAKLMPARCFSSPMLRARETAASALGPNGPELAIDADLREVNFGRWEGLTFEQARHDDPAAVDRWAAGDPDFAFPGGERLADFLGRVRGVGSRLASEVGNTVVAFTHAGVIRHLICHFLGLPWRNYVLFDVRYASLAVIELFDDKGVLTGLNLGLSKEP